ncbi:MAG TPA: hypothetical protein VKQ05_09280 [Gemmatimonadales bacterium]|nr:hypothetical protein [Gemmatimonadales bacterium]
MSWRVIAHGDQVWHVDAVAERRANTAAWQLVLSFRAASEPLQHAPVAESSQRGSVGRRSFWTPYPLEATSKSSLFIQAERISDAALSQLLAERLA